MSFVELNLIDRDQRDSQVAHFFEQPVQGGLIRHMSRKKRVAVLAQCDGQAVEPRRPLGVQVSLESDLVKHNVWGRLVNHRYLSVICPKDPAGCGETSSPDDVIEVVIVENKNSSGGWSWVGRENVRTDRVLRRGGRLHVGC